MQVYELSGIQRDLLFVTAGAGGANGQQIKERLESSQGRDVLPGRLYTNLDALVERGLVEKRRCDGRTNLYDATDAGIRTLERLRRWQEQFLDDVTLSSD